MPKKTAQEVLNDLNQQNVTMLDLAGKIIDYSQNIEDPAAQDDTELEGLKQAINGHIKANNEKLLDTNSAVWLMDVSNSILQHTLDTKMEAGKKIDEIKDKIRQGQIPGTEFFLDEGLENKEKINNLATNIFVAENPDLVKKMKGQELAAKLLSEQLNGYKCSISEKEGPEGNQRDVLKVVVFNELFERDKEQNSKTYLQGKYQNVDIEKRTQRMNLKAEDMKIENANGFEINPEYKPGDNQIDLFSKQPEEINEFMAHSTKEDYEQEKENAELKKDRADKYIENTKVLAANARAMLKELDLMMKTNGKDNSTEYDEMRKALETVSKLDQPTELTEGQMQQPVYNAAEINDAIDTLRDKAAAYEQKNKSIFGKRSDYGKDRLHMSKRLQNLATIAKPVMDPKKYGLEEFDAMVTVKETEDKRIERLKAASAKKGFGELSAHKKQVPTIADRLVKAKEHALAAKEGVHGGSKEYDKAVKSYDKVAELYERFKLLNEDTEMDGIQRREALSKVQSDLANAKFEMYKYLSRKKDKGQIETGATSDLKSQKRINAVNEGIGIANAIEKEVNKYLEKTITDDINKVNEEMAKANEEPDLNYNTRRRYLSGAETILKDVKKHAEANVERYKDNNKEYIAEHVTNIKQNLETVKDLNKMIDTQYALYEAKEDEMLALDRVATDKVNEQITKEDDQLIRETYKSLVNLRKQEPKDTFTRKVAKVAEYGYRKLYEMMNENPDQPLTAQQQQDAREAMGSITFYSTLNDLNKQQINNNYAADDNTVLGKAQEFNNSIEYQNAVGPVEHINREQIREFLCTPDSLKHKTFANRDKVRQLNEQAKGNVRQQPQQNQPEANAEVGNNQPQQPAPRALN